MSERTLRGKVAIAGIGETTYYKHGHSPDAEFKLALQAVLAACRDAGIDPKEVDGFASYGNDRSEAVRLAAALGIKELRFSNMHWGGGGGGESAWYLVGHDLERGALRTFSLARMKSLVVGERRFERPADFSPEKFFGKAFGAFVGTGDYRVVIRFSAAVADQIRERFWHESQETRDRPDGEFEFAVQLGGLNKMLRWILGWAGEAEVVAPKELRELVRTRADAIAQRYASTKSARQPR